MSAAAIVVVGAILLPATSARASEGVHSFSVTASTPAAGGHPTLTTSFRLEDPGAPEAAQNVTFNTPQGVFGNPNAVSRCTSSDFASDQCPSNSQVGLITIYSNYEGTSEDLLGTAPIYDLEPGPSQTALFAFIVPTLDIPISIPVTVRTAAKGQLAGDYGLRFTVSDITQSDPLAAADLTFWGFPAEEAHNPQRFPKGESGKPAGCVGLANTSCIKEPIEAGLAVRPLTDNPTTCIGEPLTAILEVQTYHDPDNPTEAGANYPAITGCESEDFKPVLFAGPTTKIPILRRV